MTDVERRKQERYAIWVDATVQTQGTSISAIATDFSRRPSELHNTSPFLFVKESVTLF